MDAITTRALSAVESEMTSAHDRYGQYQSTHEALGVLIEEVGELQDAIRANALMSIQEEAIQVSAVAARLVVSMMAQNQRFLLRSNLK
jgi:NTP pyrophosphatase (non-canonical NTP hydrolase)